jgi:hypothetical protein
MFKHYTFFLVPTPKSTQNRTVLFYFYSVTKQKKQNCSVLPTKPRVEPFQPTPFYQILEPGVNQMDDGSVSSSKQFLGVSRGVNISDGYRIPIFTCSILLHSQLMTENR